MFWLEALARRVTGMLPAGSRARFAPCDGPVPGLHPSEAAAVARAVPSRRHEFARGRALAREALVAAGGPAPAIPVGPDRAPVWPRGWVGSISHGGGVVAAVVSPRRALVGVGLDVEGVVPLEDEVADIVLHPRERSRAVEAGLPEVALFSAKESVHKALYPGSGVWMDFLDVELRLGVDGSFTAVPAAEGRATAQGLEELRGRILVEEDLVVTLAFLPTPVAGNEGEAVGQHP